MNTTILIILLLVLGFTIFINQIQFGKTPTGERKYKIKNLQNYINGKFKNIKNIPHITGDDNVFTKIYNFIFPKQKRLKPTKAIPTIKTDLKFINKKEDIFVWFGHSSVYIQLDGINFLVDPILTNGMGSTPLYWKAFEGTNIYSPDDIPKLDYIIITHDHWDHLDYNSIIGLKDKTKKIICPIGVGENFEYWGFDKDKIIELYWDEEYEIKRDYKICALPSQHFSGRSIFHYQTLWASFLIISPSNYKIFISGDTGYNETFKKVGDKYSEIDLSIIENGQYNTDWKYVHMFPEEVKKSTNDLHSKRLLAAHNSKFVLSKHSWDEPLDKIYELSKDESYTLLTPKIGEKVKLKNSKYNFTKWWEEIE